MVEAAEMSTVVVLSADINIGDEIDIDIITEEIELKPRTVSFKEERVIWPHILLYRLRSQIYMCPEYYRFVKMSKV